MEQVIWMHGFTPSIIFCSVYLRGMWSPRLSVPCTSSSVRQDTCHTILSRQNSTEISQQLHCARAHVFEKYGKYCNICQCSTRCFLPPKNPEAEGPKFVTGPGDCSLLQQDQRLAQEGFQFRDLLWLQALPREGLAAAVPALHKGSSWESLLSDPVTHHIPALFLQGYSFCVQWPTCTHFSSTLHNMSCRSPLQFNALQVTVVPPQQHLALLAEQDRK